MLNFYLLETIHIDACHIKNSMGMLAYTWDINILIRDRNEWCTTWWGPKWVRHCMLAYPGHVWPNVLMPTCSLLMMSDQMYWSPCIDARDMGCVQAPTWEFELINNAERNRWYLQCLRRGGGWRQVMQHARWCQWMVPFLNLSYGCPSLFWYRKMSLSCILIWYLHIPGISRSPGLSIVLMALPEMGMWPSPCPSPGIWFASSWSNLCFSCVLIHHFMALIGASMVGLRHKMEVNTQMYLERWTQTTHTMTDEQEY